MKEKLKRLEAEIHLSSYNLIKEEAERAGTTLESFVAMAACQDSLRLRHQRLCSNVLRLSETEFEKL